MGKPEKKFRCGRCEAAVFENEIVRGGTTVTVKKVSFQKRYRNAKGEWGSTHSLDINDIPKAVLVLSKAYEYLAMGDGTAENSDSAEAGGVE